MDSHDFLGPALAAVRAGGRLSQKQVARVAEISPSQVSRYEMSSELPSTRTLNRLLHALGILPREFYELQDLLRRTRERRLGVAPAEPAGRVAFDRPPEAGAAQEEAARLLAQAIALLSQAAPARPPGPAGPGNPNTPGGPGAAPRGPRRI